MEKTRSRRQKPRGKLKKTRRKQINLLFHHQHLLPRMSQVRVPDQVSHPKNKKQEEGQKQQRKLAAEALLLMLPTQRTLEDRTLHREAE